MNAYLKVAIFLFFGFALEGVSAGSCDYVFKCSNGVCERVETTSCAASPSTNATVVAPPSNTIVGTATAVGAAGSAVVVRQAEVSAPATTTTPPTYGVPCAENGSCYGDVSTINGMPKTIHVDGYYRKDGTYVRGHYRSRGRR